MFSQLSVAFVHVLAFYLFILWLRIPLCDYISIHSPLMGLRVVLCIKLLRTLLYMSFCGNVHPCLSGVCFGLGLLGHEADAFNFARVVHHFMIPSAVTREFELLCIFTNS